MLAQHGHVKENNQVRGWATPHHTQSEMGNAAIMTSLHQCHLCAIVLHHLYYHEYRSRGPVAFVISIPQPLPICPLARVVILLPTQAFGMAVKLPSSAGTFYMMHEFASYHTSVEVRPTCNGSLATSLPSTISTPTYAACYYSDV